MGCGPRSSQPQHLGGLDSLFCLGSDQAMSPRIIQIPLSGGDCKAQAKGIRQVHGLSESYFEQSLLIRNAAQAKIREADRLECEPWNAIMWASGAQRGRHRASFRPKKIPTSGDWPAQQRLRWFRTFAMNVSQIYDDEMDDPVELGHRHRGADA
jgi:hypothetical protein